ncbi:DUF5305 family protein [Halalkalicoccus tibetensis]|uniref:DUF5305 family protein n=1 Tax=Halalkalicoccus tibetensis TaxID=175632 RepID=A0ABD5V6K4_9EURY
MNDQNVSDPEFKLRYYLDRYFTLVIAVLLVCLLISGWVTYVAYTDQQTETDEETLAVYDSTVDFQHSATAPEDNPLYAAGTELENQSVYFYRATPVVDGEFVYEYETTEPTDVEIETDLELVLRSTEEIDNDDEVLLEHWRQSETVGEETLQQEGSSGEHTIPFGVAIADLEHQLWTINEILRTPEQRPDDDLGSLPGDTEIAVVATTSVTTDLAGEEIEREEVNELVMDPQSGLVRVDERTETEPTEVIETSTDSVPPSVFSGIVIPLLALGSLVAVVGLAVVRSRGRVAPAPDRLRLYEEQRARKRFDDWISTGTMPEEHLQLPTTTVNSLADLVDAAIDTNSRVIEDEQLPVYHFVNGSTRYVYTPPTHLTTESSPTEGEVED